MPRLIAVDTHRAVLASVQQRIAEAGLLVEKRKENTSNPEWTHPREPDAKVAKTKDRPGAAAEHVGAAQADADAPLPLKEIVAD